MNIIKDEKSNLIRIIIGAAVYLTGFILKFTIQNAYMPFFIFTAAYIILGFDIIFKAFKNLFKGKVFDENFLMALATIGAFAIGETPEAVGVMLFYQIGEYFQEMAVEKSKKSITDLMDIRPDYANIVNDDGIKKAPPDTVNIDDLIIVKPGEKIPLDGVVIKGSSMLDTSALTGESVPRSVSVSSEVLSGCINQSGMLTVKVTKPFGESTVSKIINLVENAAGKKAKTENFITKFARVYTPIVVILAALLAILPPLLFGGEWKTWINRSLVFLVISCPCALVLSIPMGFFAGIGKAAKNGILVKGGNYLEAFSKLETAVFDKTGTLTRGVFKVTSIHNESANGFGEEELLELAANAEYYSNHPIALSVRNEFKGNINKDDLSEYSEIAGYGVSVLVKGRQVLAGNKNLMSKNDIEFKESQSEGTKVYVACGGVFAGCIVISDEIKSGSFTLVQELKKRGVSKTVMLTGDNPQIAHDVAEKLAFNEVYASLLPQEKVEIVERLNLQNINKKNAGKLAFVGDGINDAPVLAMADIGIAMGALGSDAAIEAADVVLMTDEPSKLIQAIDISKFTGRIVRENIIFTLTVKTAFLALGAFGLASMWEAVFADVGVSLLAVLNSMRIMKFNLQNR